MLKHPTQSPKPTFFGKIIALTIGLIFFVIIAEILTRIIMPHWTNFHSGSFMKLTHVPGHANVATGVPSFDDYFAQNNGDFRVRITINKFGLRNPDPIIKANNRIWVIGDSMAFGWGVEQQQMYSSLIANVSGRQTYNISSPGTTVCGYQALVDRMPKTSEPSAVVVGLIIENDILRYDCKALAQEEKNTPIDIAIECIEIQIPLIESSLVYLGLAAKPHTYRQKIKENELNFATRETVHELSILKKQFPKGTPFAVMIAPARFEIKDANPFYKKLRKEIITALNKVGITTIDPIDGFLKKGFSATHFAHDGHWNALGHEIAATAISKWILTIPE